MNQTEIPLLTSSIRIMFSWFDYTIFVLMLGVSVIIGVYFGCFGTKQSTTIEYLMGGKKMSVIPITISLVASHISGVTLLGVPADVYRYGATYWLSIISLIVTLFTTVYVYLPVFYSLKITSIYEYLERRFDAKTRMLSSFLFLLCNVLFLPIVIYIPALAFAAATGVNLHLITPIVCGVCIFYTTIGGLKAVVWTDTIQFTLTLASVTVVIFLGVQATGGFGTVWQKSLDGGRLDIFNFNLDSSDRDNFWAVAIGFTVHWISNTNTDQSCIQKFLSVSTLKKAKLSAFYYTIGMSLVKSASVITGLIIYARYSNCDPFLTEQITRNDQLLPYYVLDVAGNIPGLPGLFISGVFSAALSTLSAHLNCVCGTIFEDFIVKHLPRDITEKTKSNILKLLVVILGILSTLCVFICEHLGGILPLAISFRSVTTGPLLGMFTLGVFSRRANSKGAFYGGAAGLSVLLYIIMGTQYYKAQGLLKYPTKPLYTDQCDFIYNTTTTSTYFNSTISTIHTGVPMVFTISHYYYTMIGATVTMTVGMIISCLTKPDHVIIDENLLCPLVQRPPTVTIGENRCVQYKTVEQALHLVVNNSDKNDKQMNKI